MSDVKWIKIVTDIFDDEKILLIEALTDADQIIVIWFKLLCLTGKINNKGVLMLNDRIPYTEDMLSTIFRRKPSVVKMALKTFAELGMIEIINDVITIPNWSKHQNLDQLEQKKEYMRTYMQEYREKQKLLTCKTNGKTNGKANVSSADKDKDKEREKNKKSLYGSQKNVRLTDGEVEKLIDYMGSDYERMLDVFSEGIAMKNYGYRNHYLAMRSWYRNELDRKQKPMSRKERTDQAIREFIRKEEENDW